MAPRSERSLRMRFHTQTAGVSLTAQQPEVNIVRTAIEALAGVLPDDEGHALLPQPARRSRLASGTAARGRHRTAASPRSASAPPPAPPAPCSSPSTTTEARSENQAGSGAPRPRGRRSRHRAHGHAALLPAHDAGSRAWKTSWSRWSAIRSPVARAWQTPLGFSVHRRRSRRGRRVWPTTRATGHRTFAPGGTLRDPRRLRRLRGRAVGEPRSPRVGSRAVADGFQPQSTTGSLRVLRRG